MEPSRSPDRHTFQRDQYVDRCRKENKEPDLDYMKMFQDVIDRDMDKWTDPKNREYNLEWDLVTTDWILEKVRASETYAQNIYAALCNNDFVKAESLRILRQDPEKDLWGCSWRHAGGIVANMRQSGDYVDWYCSGSLSSMNGYVPEGEITREVRADFFKLGWIPVQDGDWEEF